MLTGKVVRLGLVAIMVLVTICWFLKPKTVRAHFAESGVTLVKKERDSSDWFGTRAPTAGIYVSSVSDEKILISILKKAGFRTEVALSTGSVYLPTGRIDATIRQFIRNNRTITFLGRQRAWIVTTAANTKVYFDPDMN